MHILRYDLCDRIDHAHNIVITRATDIYIYILHINDILAYTAFIYYMRAPVSRGTILFHIGLYMHRSADLTTYYIYTYILVHIRWLYSALPLCSSIVNCTIYPLHCNYYYRYIFTFTALCTHTHTNANYILCIHFHDAIYLVEGF